MTKPGGIFGQIFVTFSEKLNFIENACVILVLRRLQEWRERKDRQLQIREWQEQNRNLNLNPSGADMGISKVSKRYSPFNHWQDGQLGNMENQEQVHQRILEGTYVHTLILGGFLIHIESLKQIRRPKFKIFCQTSFLHT